MQAAFSTSRTGCRAATRTVTRKSVSAGRRPAETRCWWIALAMLALSPVGAPVAAQSGSEAVVCVGSERRTLATNPIRRIYMEDMEIVYRIGVDIGQRDQIERTLSSELGSYPEVWCAWSDPGDDHAVIVGYTGVIRQDLTVDPEDPRFQAFSVGFGTGFNAAEAQATTINQRFSSRYDGSGYEVLLRETWSVARETVAEVGGPEPNLPEGRICTEVYSPESCWMELADRPGCYLWNPAPQENVTVTWTRGCSNGLAQGSGQINWYQNGDLIETTETRLREGQLNGWTAIRVYGVDALEAERCYVNGEVRGWIERFTESLSAEQYWEWTYSFSGGERIVVNMESDDVDSYLRVLRDDETEIGSNDDGGSGVNARVEFRVPTPGQYRIRASAYDEDDSGSFVLWVGDRDPGTMNLGDACGPR